MSDENINAQGLAYQPPAGEYLNFYRFDLIDGTSLMFASIELRYIRVLDAGLLEFLFHTHLLTVEGRNLRGCADRLFSRRLLWLQELSETEIQGQEKSAPVVSRINVYPLASFTENVETSKKPARRGIIA